MKKTWHKGPPPHIGWWNASLARDDESWRWWDGVKWSEAAGCSYGAEVAAFLCTNAEVESSSVEWNDSYPENARVPRVKPSRFSDLDRATVLLVKLAINWPVVRGSREFTAWVNAFGRAHGGSFRSVDEILTELGL